MVSPSNEGNAKMHKNNSDYRVIFTSFLLMIITFSAVMMIQQNTRTVTVETIPNEQPASSIDTTQGWYEQATKNLSLLEYSIRYQEKTHSYQSPNRANNIRASYLPGKMVMEPRVNDPQQEKWQVQLSLQSIRFGKQAYTPSPTATVANNADTIRFNHQQLFTEEYINTAEGVRQNFIIHKAPEEECREVQVHLELSGGLTPMNVNENEIHFAKQTGEDNWKNIITYKDLKAWDAGGTPLDAHMETNGDLIALVVNTEKALFPITIDPISTTVSSQLESNQATAFLGVRLCTAGDVNGDGYSDVIVGADGYDNGQSNEGAAFIYHGSSTGIGTSIITQLEGNQASASFGRAVATAGDVNGDGYSDVIVGSTLFDNGQADEGAAFVYHGSSSGITTTIRTQLELNQASATFGVSVACAGDVNNDGYSDVIVGATDYDNGQADEGGAFVFHGSSSGITTTIQVQLECNQATSDMGINVAGAGDVNGDGYSDVIVGASIFDNGQADEGAAFVYHGGASGITTTVQAQLENNQAGALMGTWVSSAGDVNGDGYSDVIVGSTSYDNGQADEGAAFVYHGSGSGISTTIQAQLESNQASAGMGNSVACAGDVNGDGYSDVIVGSRLYDNGATADEGAAFFYLGSATGINAASFTLMYLNTSQASAYFGRGVSSAGDVNGDGYSDVIISASNFTNGQANEGAAFIYLGSAAGLNTAIGTQLERNQASANFGISISAAGDVNGDGYTDVIVGANLYDNGSTNEGGAFVYHGSATGLSTSITTQLEINQADAQFGFGVSNAGDVNGDGYGDVIVGAKLYDNGQADEGAAFVYHGSSSGITTTIQTQLERNQAGAYVGNFVSNAGDVNGDGYGDVIIGAQEYTNGQAGEGAAFVHHGSSSGITTTVQSQLECNLAGANMGCSVASAGDVNGDGFADVIVGVDQYDNGQNDEGRVYIYHGSITGINTTAALIMESNQADCYYGCWATSAGDVNGDGYSDIIVAASFYDNGTSNEGAAFVYHGSSSGITNTIRAQMESGQASSRFGYCVSSAGDVNGDGYSDVMVGADRYDNGQADEGAVFVYMGSSTGINTAIAAQLEINSASAYIGTCVAPAGDVNGDGYSDIIISGMNYTNGQANEGTTLVYYGNSSPTTGKRRNLRLYNSNLTSRIDRSNVNSTTFGAGLFAKSFIGRADGKLVWEARRQGLAFTSGTTLTNSLTFTAQQSSLTDMGVAGIEIKNLVSKPTGFYVSQTKIRARIAYDKITAITGQMYGPWIYIADYQGGNFGMGSAPLPVELLSFTAVPEGSQVHLNWQTATEINNDYFLVERSKNAIVWEPVKKVKGAGNSNKILDYREYDEYPYEQTSYYRLKQTDYNGQYSYSNVVTVNFGTMQDQMTISPNPAVNELNIYFKKEINIVTIDLFNDKGQKIMRVEPQNFYATVERLDISSLNGGSYFIRIQTTEYIHPFIAKFIKLSQ